MQRFTKFVCSLMATSMFLTSFDASVFAEEIKDFVNDNENNIGKIEEGNDLELVANDTYRDHSSNGVQRIKRDSDGKMVNVFIGEKQIIGDEVEPVEKELESIWV